MKKSKTIKTTLFKDKIDDFGESEKKNFLKKSKIRLSCESCGCEGIKLNSYWYCPKCKTKLGSSEKKLYPTEKFYKEIIKDIFVNISSKISVKPGNVFYFKQKDLKIQIIFRIKPRDYKEELANDFDYCFIFNLPDLENIEDNVLLKYVNVHFIFQLSMNEKREKIKEIISRIFKDSKPIMGLDENNIKSISGEKEKKIYKKVCENKFYLTNSLINMNINKRPGKNLFDELGVEELK